MIKDQGLASLFPGVRDEEEEQLQAQAKEAVMKRLNVQPTTLQAAPIEDVIIPDGGHISFTPKFYENTKTPKQIEKEKFKKDFEKEYGDGAIKKDILGKVQANRKAGKRDYENFTTSQIIVADDIATKAKGQLNVMQKNKKNIVNKPAAGSGHVMVDPSHPDGFRFTDAKDLYNNYGDNPERYIQEVMYLYEDGPAPTAGVVKPFDSLDKSTFPVNQKKELQSYQKAFDKLTPLQKQQVANKKKVKPDVFDGIGKRLDKLHKIYD